jgi:glutamyl-tRNA synthetase
VLRIEDTDKERNREEFVDLIYGAMRWLGMDWDEGPGKSGAHGPYRQSERAALYAEYLAKLKANGRAYEKEGAWWLRLEGERYEGFDELKKIPVEKVRAPAVVIADHIRGRVERAEEQDFVIYRSNGEPVFHFVNVVDDITMGITHVIRGEDHLSNTSKHVLLYQAFGAKVPEFAHIPLILKEQGSGKMSKRDQGALIEDYQKRGYLPEAIVNFISLLGWNPKNDVEKMPIAEIVRLFDLPGVNQSNARFDSKKLAHMNMCYLLELPPARFLALARAWLSAHGGESARPALVAPAGYLDEVLTLAQPKIKSLEELPAYTGYFFSEDYATDAKAREKTLAKGDPQARLLELDALLVTADFSTDGTLEAALKVLAAEKNLGFGDYQGVLRLALTGSGAGPSITAILRVLGRERSLARLRRFAVTL